MSTADFGFLFFHYVYHYRQLAAAAKMNLSQNGKSSDLSSRGIGELSSPTRWPRGAKLILVFSYSPGVSCSEQVTAIAKDEKMPNPVFFIDDGYSGTDFDRHVTFALTKDLSRLGRNFTMTGMFINITFAKHNVRYIAINDNFDTMPKTNSSAFTWV